MTLHMLTKFSHNMIGFSQHESLNYKKGLLILNVIINEFTD